MDMDDYQLKAIRTALYEDRMYPVVSLMVEAAELADLFVKPLLRGDAVEIDRVQVISEAGDVLWNLACLLEDNGLTLREVAQYNIQKLERRLQKGTIQGKGER